MSFWPLPTTLVEHCARAASHGAVVELGAGDGEFSKRLADLNLRPWLLDRRRLPPRAGFGRIQAEALALPLRRACVGLLILADTLRHLPGTLRPRLASELTFSLAPRGRLLVLEDHPEARSPAEKTYRDVLALLAKLDATRGSVLAPTDTARDFAFELGEPLAEGEAENELRVREPTAPLDWIATRPTSLVDPATLAELRRHVESDGMAYGRYWWQLYGRTPA